MPLTIPPYEGQGWTDNSPPDLSAETLNAVDDGIAAVTNGVNAIAAAVVSQIINDPEKIASIAVAYAQQQQINTINSNLTLISNDLIGKIGTVEFYYETVPIASQAQLDTLINNVYATLNKTGGNLVYKILLSISASGLTIPGGTHLLSGYIYGNSTSYHGAQQILIRSTGIKSRSCAANTWSAWA